MVVAKPDSTVVAAGHSVGLYSFDFDLVQQLAGPLVIDKHRAEAGIIADYVVAVDENAVVSAGQES